MIKTYLNIAFSTFVASYFIKNLLNQHTKAIKTIFKDLKKIHT